MRKQRPAARLGQRGRLQASSVEQRVRGNMMKYASQLGKAMILISAAYFRQVFVKASVG